MPNFLNFKMSVGLAKRICYISKQMNLKHCKNYSTAPSRQPPLNSDDIFNFEKRVYIQKSFSRILQKKIVQNQFQNILITRIINLVCNLIFEGQFAPTTVSMCKFPR